MGEGMNRLKTWASGCALGVALCSGAQAELIDSVRSGDNAYLISETHLYVYDSLAQTVAALVLDRVPVAVDAAADGVFVAYPSGVEKRGFDGALLSDASGPIQRSLTQTTDILVHDTTLYAAFADGEGIYPLSTADLSAVGGGAYFSLPETTPMRRLVAYPSNGEGALQALYSPSSRGKGLFRVSFPVTTDPSSNHVDLDSFVLPPGHDEFLDEPENLFLLEGATGNTILMDNGAEWAVDGTYNGWIAGQGFHFLDQAEDDNWSLVRDKVVACEPEELRSWGSDLIHYDHTLRFNSRDKAGTPEALFDVVHLWGAGANPASHLFRESAPGTLEVRVSNRADGQDYDDGKVPYSVAADESLSEYQLEAGLKSRHVTLNDDNTRAYVLHQGNATCQSMVRVYNLETDTWEAAIPLRWRADALALVGGAQADTTDDQLGVVYEVAYDAYGRSDPLVSFIDLNAAVQEENETHDFSSYGAFYHDLSTVEASRHAVLFQLELGSSPPVSVISAVGSGVGLDTYIHCNSATSSCTDTDIHGWDSRAELAETAGLVVNADRDLAVLNYTEDETTFTFSAPYANELFNATMSDVEAPLVASADQTLIALNLPQDAPEDNSIVLFDKNGQAYSEGKPQDFLPGLLGAATWSENAQGTAGYYALYNLNGGDNAGTTASRISRWLLTLGADGHVTFEPAGEGTLAGFPLRVDVVDPATDSLLLTTVYQGQYRFTPIDKDITNAPGFVPDAAAGGGDSGDDDGGSSSGGGNSSAVSGSGFSSGGGGGGAMGSLLGVLLLIALRRRTTTTH